MPKRISRTPTLADLRQPLIDFRDALARYTIPHADAREIVAPLADDAISVAARQFGNALGPLAVALPPEGDDFITLFMAMEIVAQRPGPKRKQPYMMGDIIPRRTLDLVDWVLRRLGVDLSDSHADIWKPASELKTYGTPSYLYTLSGKYPELREHTTEADRQRWKNYKLVWVYNAQRLYELTEGKPRS